ncbi:uncharacterized protein A4U43_C07F28400 [Asparagus officinalis]|uniref:Glucosamine inositolphosphorylceramide transferase 1 N-terminal domain-containing protein n=1 Tax=Asparagus officinalis TaxID=4686 RepID=A0A5P1EJ74_ASPOF|nr:uncharacterized protein A4U43_C07F28400 [Asparagus officinalis]
MVIFDRRSAQVLRSKPFIFFFSSVILLGSVAFVFSWIAFSRFERPVASPTAKLGCRPDGEGSWAIGVFYGDSPFSLKPVEDWNVWRNESEAWPGLIRFFLFRMMLSICFLKQRTLSHCKGTLELL